METGSEFDEKLEEFGNKLITYNVLVGKLIPAVNERVTKVLRQDQANSLDDLQSRIMRDVDIVRSIESEAKGEFNRQQLAREIPSFMHDLYKSISGKGNSPQEEIPLMRFAIRKEPPFGTVLIAMGPRGLPENVRVISLSEFARRSNQTERTARETLQNRGYLLITPNEFTTLIADLKSNVISGSSVLPLSIDQISTVLSRRYVNGTEIRRSNFL